MINKLPDTCMNCDRADFKLDYIEGKDFFGGVKRFYTIRCNKEDVCVNLIDDTQLELWDCFKGGEHEQ